ncbi:aminodeoxychorismate synthase component I [bacterium]|nr:aminodeoxychorismate synthase component I [bacterium]
MKQIGFSEIEAVISRKETVVLFLSTHKDNEGVRNLFFHNPVEVLSIFDSSQVDNVLNQVDNRIKQGLWAAGFISYEAGYAFEDKLRENRKYPFPLVWFGIFSNPLELNYSQTDVLKWLNSVSDKSRTSIGCVTSSIDKTDYLTAVNSIKKYIFQGDIYQANYTYKKNFFYSGNPFGIFAKLHLNQPVGYSAYIQNDSSAVLSLSPELFFTNRESVITVKPMKGTIKRGKTAAEDLRQSRELASCLKNRAENIMIVDLMRNDIAKACRTGSVETTNLFDVTSYSTLFQMTSTVKGNICDNVSIRELITKIFPSGSVTGAPKIRAMQLIKDLETAPRGVYTGSIGYISPSNDAVFNIAIRTLCLDEQTKTGELGIGSGIVSDSSPEKEFEECVLKSNFLFEQNVSFKLIETILWDANSFFVLDLHLKRLKKSAGYFDFCFDEKKVVDKLKKVSFGFCRYKKYKVRLLLDRYGDISVETYLLDTKSSDNENVIMLSDDKICSGSVFFYHKTTNRNFYDKQLQRYRQKGCFDVIFRNERDEITEGAISNIFIKKDGVFYTPPVHCGLLSGTYRDFFIGNNYGLVREKILYKTDLLSADEIFLTNSVQGMIKVNLIQRELPVREVGDESKFQ